MTVSSLNIAPKDLLQYAILLLSLAGLYYGTQQSITSNQLKTEAAIREVMLLRQNDLVIYELKEQHLRLKIEQLELEIRGLKDTINKPKR
jgi:hypothetical protein